MEVMEFHFNVEILVEQIMQAKTICMRTQISTHSCFLLIYDMILI